MLAAPAVTFGSAQLLAPGASVAEARSLLEAALVAGATRLDTAPLYGHGLSEQLVAEVAAAAGVPFTTKVGLEPGAPPSSVRRAAGRLLRAAPAPVGTAARWARERLRSAPPDDCTPSGRFTVSAVRASAERSLRRAEAAGGGARLDRLLLHEVRPADVTDELLDVLGELLASGDVGAVGTATENELTPACLARGAGLLTVAHVSAARSGPGVPVVPPGVHVVGHGLLGVGGADLAAVRRALRRGGSDVERSGGTDGGRVGKGTDGLVARLLRSAAAGLPEVVVATRRLDRVRGLVQGASRADDAAGDPLRGTLLAESGREGRA